MSLQTVIEYLKTVSSKGIGRTLFVRFLVFAILPMALVGFVSINNGVATIKESRLKGLSIVAKTKQERLSEYFSLTETNLRLEADLVNTISFLSELKSAYKNYTKSLKKFTSSYQWAIIEEEYGKDLSHALAAYNYIDILLLDEKGNVLYSLRRDDELGTNIFNGKYVNTKFSSAAKKAIKSGLPVYSDMEFYPPYNDKISSFYIQAIVDEYGEKIGLIAIHLSNDPIKMIMTETTNFGETGETYLVGKDLLMRSQSNINNKSILITQVNTKQIKKWLAKLEINMKKSKNEDFEIESGVYNSYKDVLVLGVQVPFTVTDIPMLVISEISQQEAYMPANKLIFLVLYIALITVLVVFIISIYSARIITLPITNISDWAKEISAGNLLERDIITPDNEIGILNKTFCSLVESLQTITWMMESFSVGDLSTKIEKRSENDILIFAIIQLQDSMRLVVEQANDIANGNYANSFMVRGKRDELGSALINMTMKLQEATVTSDKLDWMKSGQTGLSEVMQGDLSLDVLTNNVIDYLCQYLSANVGLIYTVDDNSIMLKATYACNVEKILKDQYVFGEGMIGQCVLDQRLIIFNEVPENYLKIESGLGSILPEQILIVPLIYNKKVYGVIELCFIKTITDEKLAFLDVVDESIAIVVSTVFSRDKINETLLDVQEKSEELQAQQEELKASNEELEEQTQLLRQSEKELTVANEELEEKSIKLNIEKKSVEIKNKEVELKAKELAAASKYKTEFLTNMSHELRTPLNSLLILAKMLSDNSDGNLNERQIQWAKVINNSGSELLDLINEILDLSKVEAGKMDVNIKCVKVSDLVRSINDKFEPLAKNKKIEFVINNELKNIHEFVSDLQRLEQILKNLLSNAIKFTEKGKVTFSLYIPDKTVKFSNKQLINKKLLALSVKDTGIGIAQEKLDAIFNAFQQEDGSTSRKYGGTGLGLSISKELARLLKGEIAVESKQNKGCIFTLYLPIDYGEITHTDEVKISEKNILPVPDENNDLKEDAITPINSNSNMETFILDDRLHLINNKKIILIIEDNKDFATLLLELVRRHDYMGLVAGNGRNGIKMADAYNPTAILLDIGLPDMNGEDVLSYIKGHIKIRHIPVHIISGNEKENKYLQQGAIGFLTKPVDMNSIELLFSKINKIVDNKHKTILLIEDNKDTQIAVSTLLENEYTNVISTADIKTAKSVLTNKIIDCVLLDIGLPDSDGIDFIKELKENYLEDCPLIVHTGKVLTNNELNELNQTANSVIIKCAESYDRLLDETMLFLHQVDSKLPSNQLSVIHSLHNPEEIFRDKNILIVDDDMRNLFALSGLLAEHGMNVSMAENGQDALNKLAENDDFDLILIDIMMPVMDGYETMKRIKQNNKLRSIPIISLTAKAMPKDRQKCIDAGANDYLTKPIDGEKLLSLMRVWLHK